MKSSSGNLCPFQLLKPDDLSNDDGDPWGKVLYIASMASHQQIDWSTAPRSIPENFLEDNQYWFLHNDCYYTLGLLDEDEQGQTDSSDEAFKHYTESARLGNTLAMVRLGHLYVKEAKKQCCSWLSYYAYSLINHCCFVPWRTEQGEKAAALFKLAEALGNIEAKQIMEKARNEGDMVLQIRPGIENEMHGEPYVPEERKANKPENIPATLQQLTPSTKPTTLKDNHTKQKKVGNGEIPSSRQKSKNKTSNIKEPQKSLRLQTRNAQRH